MNTEFINYCIKSVRRRWKSLLRAALSIFLVFAFVTGIMLFKSNMYQWQLQSAKQRFGNWIVMLYDSNKEENKELKNHPYLNESGKASIDNYVYEEGECTDIKVGYMTDEFLRIGNISLQCGRMPEKDDEAASVYIMISIMGLNNRINQYKPVMQLLRRSGADKSVVFNILLSDCIWQNLYCIILIPVMLLIESIIIRKNVT